MHFKSAAGLLPRGAFVSIAGARMGAEGEKCVKIGRKRGENRTGRAHGCGR